MPLRYSPEPQGGAALVRDGLNRVAARKSHLSTKGVDFGALQLKPPHVIYDLRADEIAKGGGLATAHLAGFRYMVHAADGAVAAAEVQADAAGKATLLTTLSYGPFVAATARALDQLAALSAVKETDYQVRLLRFTAIPLLAIWLKGERGDPDIIYPLAPAPDVLKAETVYSEADFLKAVLPLAQKRVSTQGGQMVP